MTDLNTLKNRLFIFSFGLGLASTVGVFQPNPAIKDIAKVALCFSVSSVILGELLVGSAMSNKSNESRKFQDLIDEKEKENRAITKNLDATINELKSSQDKNLLADSALVESFEIINTRKAQVQNLEAKLAYLQNNELADLKAKLREVGKFNTERAHQLVRDVYNRSIKKLEAHLEALMRNYKPIADDINKVLIDADKFRNRYLKKLEEYEQLTSFDDLLDIGLDMQQKIIEGCIELRVKAQQICIRYLDNLIENAVDISQYEQDIEKLQNLAGQTIHQLKAENEAQVRAIVSDWVVANNEHVRNYEINYTELIEDGKMAVAMLRERDYMIQEINQELEELRKPWNFTGSIDYALAGNAIINFYYRAYGYKLDAIAWNETETGYTLTFATGRNQTYLTADMLEDKDNMHQLAGLTNALTLPKFTPNYQSGLMTLSIQTRQATKKTTIEKLEADISKIWVPVEKFESYVKNFERIRVTAGSTGGKSPTAKNLALAIMNSRQGKKRMKLYDPQHGSKKDYWNMPKAGTGHEDNFAGVKELCELIDTRRNGRNHEFTLYLFDEIDNTVANLGKKSSEFKNYLKIALKEGSHCNIGAIFIGQSADANEIPGMTHSNWNNCVQIHIGSNAGIAIDKLTTITTEDKTRLLEQYRKIQDYCDRKNDELGLDIFTDATAFRFALVIPLNGLPKFIQLPDFDSYEYDAVMSINTQNGTLSNNLDSSNKESENTVSDVNIKCPHCGSPNIGSKGTHYHRCNVCNKTWKRKSNN
jgi:hypothetical protein